MSTTENETTTQEPSAPEAEEKKGGFAKDKAFGNRLDTTFAIGEPFLLLGAVPDEPVQTKFGLSDCAKLLCQKINPETGAPQGAPIRCVTVASAIVEKVLSLDPSELAAGPVVQLQVVTSKARGQNALVLSWMRNLADDDDFSDFGLDAGAVDRLVDQARPQGQRLPRGY